jgi:flagellar biosynthesis/type III secretory pathway chaperone
MTALLEGLADILVEETACVRELLSVLEEQERVLLRADAAALAALVTRQQALVTSLGDLEGSRRATLGRLAGQLGVERERLTFSTLGQRVRAMPERLAAVRDELRQALGALARRNERNGFLLDRSLGYVERLLAQLLPTRTPVPVYAATGRATPVTPVLTRLDRRA